MPLKIRGTEARRGAAPCRTPQPGVGHPSGTQNNQSTARLKEAYRRIFEAGAQIFREGESGSLAYIIERGEVEISSLIKGSATPLARLREGELFGEMALIGDNVRSATATALCHTEVIIVSRDYVKDKIIQADPLLNLFLRVILKRLRTMGHSQPQRSGMSTAGGDGIAAPDESDVREQFLDRLHYEREMQSALESSRFELCDPTPSYNSTPAASPALNPLFAGIIPLAA